MRRSQVKGKSVTPVGKKVPGIKRIGHRLPIPNNFGEALVFAQMI